MTPRSNSFGLPLRLILVVPFLIQIGLAVGITGWLSIRNGEQAVDDVAQQLREATSERIQDNIVNYIGVPHQVNQLNADAILLEHLAALEDRERERHFGQRMHTFPVITHTFWAHHENDTLVEYFGARRFEGDVQIIRRDPNTGENVYYATDDQGYAGAIAQVAANFDPRTRPWYEAAIEADSAAWSGIYQDFSTGGLAMTASLPIYDDDGTFRGVLGTALLCGDQINEILERHRIGEQGETFIVDSQGALVGTSTDDPIFVPGDDRTKRIPAADSDNSLIQETATTLQTLIPSWAELTQPQQLAVELGGDRHFLQITPLNDDRGLDWQIITVVPRSEFMAQIEANTRRTILLCGVALVVATGLGLLTSRWITGSVQRLSLAANDMTQGHLDQQVPHGPISELNRLTTAFNRMAAQLRESFSELEARVAQRTQALKAAKEEADSANRAKSTFLANMSHELRTPLNAILGFTQLMARRPTLSDEERHNLTVINRSGEHLLTLINDVLEMSKIEAGRMTLAETQTDLYDLLYGIEAMLKLRADDKGLILAVRRSPAAPRHVEVDDRKLQQVLINLLSNAIKFTACGSVTLTVMPVDEPAEHEPVEHEPVQRSELAHPSESAERSQPSERLKQTEPSESFEPIESTESGAQLEQSERPDRAEVQQGAAVETPTAATSSARQWLRFQVQDTGPGIAPDEQAKLFEAFVQTQTGERSREGTGLGLPISRQFVKLMGGDIQVSSKLGVGTTFFFDIPVWPVAGVDRPLLPRSVITGLADGQNTPYVLVVDDVEENRQLLVKLLLPLGFEVITAENGQEALDQWRSASPDLILMDMRMPVMDGYEAARQIRNHERQHRIEAPMPIVALTASAFEEERGAVLAAGCNDFIRKPFQAEPMLEKIGQLLNLRYRYADTPTIVDPHESVTSLNLKVAAEAIAAQPVTWQQQLYQTAAQADDEALLQVIAQLPDSHASLRQVLVDLTQVFQFDQVMELVSADAAQPLINERIPIL